MLGSEFVMFEGRYDDFRAEGGSVGKEKYLDRKERDGKNKRRPERFSENKWKDRDMECIYNLLANLVTTLVAAQSFR